MPFKNAVRRGIAEIKRGKEVYEVGGKVKKPNFYLQRIGNKKNVGTVHDVIPEKGWPSTYMPVRVKPPYDPELVKIGFRGEKLSGNPHLQGMGTAQQFIRSKDIQGMDFDYPSEGTANPKVQNIIKADMEELNSMKKKELDHLKKMGAYTKSLRKQKYRPKGTLKGAGGASSGIRDTPFLQSIRRKTK